MLAAALAPRKKVRLAVDNSFMFPQLGVLATVDPDLAVRLYRELGLKLLPMDGEAEATPPPPRIAVTTPAMPVRGPVTIRRELAAEGEILVAVGDEVSPETVIGRCTRKFLRPFFLPVARALDIEPERLPELLEKGVGDEIRFGETLARVSLGMFRHKAYQSPVSGTIVRFLPDGTIVVREREEEAVQLRAVEVAKELEISARKLAPHIKVEVDEEVEKGQALAMRFTGRGVISCPSPFRGRVERIDHDFGIMLIAPLAEELMLRAWFPGRITATDPRGVTIENRATSIRGVWGHLGEGGGPLVLGRVEPGHVSVYEQVGKAELAELAARGAAGLVAGSLPFAEVLEHPPEFPIVLTEGFGKKPMRPELLSVLRENDRRLAVLSGTTELRVGVRRPRVLLPE